MSHHPYQPPTWVDLALERPFPMEDVKMSDQPFQTRVDA